MKKIFTLLFVLATFSCFEARAQSDSVENPGIGIKINFADYKYPGLQIETKLHKKKYLHFEAVYRESNNELSFDASSDKISRVHLFADARFYLGRKAPFQGYFISPFFSLNYFRDQRYKTKQRELELYDERTYYLGGGITTGYQFVIRSRVLLDFHLGLGMLRQVVEKKEVDQDWYGFEDSLGEWSNVLRIGLSLGYRFGKKY